MCLDAQINQSDNFQIINLFRLTALTAVGESAALNGFDANISLPMHPPSGAAKNWQIMFFIHAMRNRSGCPFCAATGWAVDLETEAGFESF